MSTLGVIGYHNGMWTCPKCSQVASVIFHEGTNENLPQPREYLWLTCECGYEWKSAPLDTGYEQPQGDTAAPQSDGPQDEHARDFVASPRRYGLIRVGALNVHSVRIRRYVHPRGIPGRCMWACEGMKKIAEKSLAAGKGEGDAVVPHD